MANHLSRVSGADRAVEPDRFNLRTPISDGVVVAAKQSCRGRETFFGCRWSPSVGAGSAWDEAEQVSITIGANQSRRLHEAGS
jgi:hypothetical protein